MKGFGRFEMREEEFAEIKCDVGKGMYGFAVGLTCEKRHF